MLIRRTALAALLVGSFASVGHAERLHTGGIPLSANNAVVGANIAAGIGNAAQQQMVTNQAGGGQMSYGQRGPGGHPLVVTNTQVATNVAAGIGNTARQTSQVQQGGPMVGLDFSGRGPLVTTNVGVNTNVAAGLGNNANQGVLSQQR